uniref:Putative secreted protein n=1 Tax=Amblyomma aureolatum TaxID=187763 RepID=A0A1E1X1W5_9ACAR
MLLPVLVAVLCVAVRCQEGNDCACSVLLEVEGAEPLQLYKEKTSILGSLCTDADFEFCSEFCKKDMASFAGDLKETLGNATLGQTLCNSAKKPVAGGLVKLAATVCDQDAREIDLKQAQKLCCDKNVKWEPCSGASSQ